MKIVMKCLALCAILVLITMSCKQEDLTKEESISQLNLNQFGIDHSISDKIDGVGASLGFTVGGTNGEHYFIQ